MGQGIAFAASNEPIHVIASSHGTEQQLEADSWDLDPALSSRGSSINLDAIEYGVYISTYPLQ